MCHFALASEHFVLCLHIRIFIWILRNMSCMFIKITKIVQSVYLFFFLRVCMSLFSNARASGAVHLCFRQHASRARARGGGHHNADDDDDDGTIHITILMIIAIVSASIIVCCMCDMCSRCMEITKRPNWTDSIYRTHVYEYLFILSQANEICF